jgi:ABC-2 type transport system ATP-binding protein
MESKVTILLTTQYLEEADQLADRIAVIDGGTIIAEGTADELKGRVGKERLELTIRTGADFKKAVEAVDGEALQADEKRRTLSVATKGGVAEVKRVLDHLEDAGVDVEALSLHKPTLDDVFLQLTGHKAEKETAGEEETAATETKRP